jgi:hypothetical protein
MPRTVADAQPVIGMGWSLYPTEDWQIISQHISAITFSKFLAAWTRWQCPQTETGYTSRRPETFRDIFDEKDKKIREALPGAGSPGHGVPLWLVIISDTLTDMTSHLFPSNEADRVELFRAIRESGYDLANSPFTEVWLYSDFHQQKLRLHPADIR